MAFLGIAPTGTVLPFAGSTAPEGWALCDGSAISRTTYSKLFGVISTTYGIGDNSSTFNVPDMRGVYPRGAGTNGTANYGGVTGHTPAGGTLAAKGGQKTAKNGLANSGSNTVSGTAAGQTVSSSTVSVSGAKNQMNGSSGNQSVDHSHLQYYQQFGSGGPIAAPSGGWVIGSGGGASGGTNQYTGGISTGHNHSWDFGAATFSASGSISALSLNSSSLTATAAAPTISSTDTETTPAFLALNYIIKL
jgi:microcystin-dependent protein